MRKYISPKVLFAILLAVFFLVPISNQAFAGWGYNYSADQDCNTELGSTGTLADGSVILYKYPWSNFSTAFGQREYKAVPILNMVNTVNDGTNHIKVLSWSSQLINNNNLTANMLVDAISIPLTAYPEWGVYATPTVDLSWFNNIGTASNKNWYTMGNAVTDSYIQVQYGGHTITLIAWALRNSNSTSYYSLYVMTLLVDGNVANTPTVDGLPYRSLAYYPAGDVNIMLAGGNQSELYLIVQKPIVSGDANSIAFAAQSYYPNNKNISAAVNKMAVAVQANDSEGTSPTPSPQLIPRSDSGSVGAVKMAQPQEIKASAAGTVENIGNSDAKKTGDILVVLHEGGKMTEIKAPGNGLWIPDPKLKSSTAVTANQLIGYFIPTSPK